MAVTMSPSVTKIAKQRKKQLRVRQVITDNLITKNYSN